MARRRVRVLKGCSVPLRDPSGEVLFCVEAPVEAFEGYLTDLREFLARALRLAGNPIGASRLEFLADMIAVYLKAPLLVEPIPELALSPFKAYVAWRILAVRREAMRDLSGPLDSVLEKLTDSIKDVKLSSLLRWLEDRAKRAERLLISIPADTRPGYNSSSLLIHWMTVSALAWAQAYQMGVRDRRRLAVLRLAALLHDVGKPISPQIHVQKGVEVVSQLLGDLISKQDLMDVLDVIKHHHAPSDAPGIREELRPLIMAIRDADRASAAADRVDEVVRREAVPRIAEALGMEEGEVFDRLYRRGGPESWALWSRVPEAVVREATEACARSLAEPPSPVRGGEREPRLSGVHFLLLDVAGIQSFVWEAEKLSIVSASSYIVDLAVTFNALRALQARLSEAGTWFPVEAFLYSAGGNILAAVPEDILDEIRRLLKNSFGRDGLGTLGELEIRLAQTVFRPDYRLVYSELERQLLEEKISVIDRPKDSLTGIEKACEFCGKRPATEEYSVAGEKSDICEVCHSRFRFFKERGHLKVKWETARLRGRTIQEVFGGIGWRTALFTDPLGEEVPLSERILEIIAGHDPEEFSEGGEGPERLLNLALLKMDGNLMGAFMAKSYSISDALEKSARIDLALKGAFRRVVERYLPAAVDAAVRELGVSAPDAPSREAARLLLGLQYMGGDDALIFTPSWVAIPLAVAFILEFAREMGHYFDPERCTSYGGTLSVGIVVAPPRQNVWMLLSAVEELLEIAKSHGRLQCYTGALAFDVTERGALTGGVVATRLREAASLGLTSQPWVLSIQSLPAELRCDPMRSLRVGGPTSQSWALPTARNGLRLLEFLFDVSLHDPSDASIEKFLTGLFESAYKAFLAENRRGRGEPRATGTRVKLLRDLVREVQRGPEALSLAPGDPGYLNVMRLFLARQIAREGDRERKKLMQDFFEILIDWSEPVPLQDLDKASKILMGGAR